MATCPKCNKELSDGAKFCGGCGAQIFETIFCPNCGKQTSTEFASCQSCGASITETPTEEQPVAAPTEKKKLTKKAIMFGGIGVVVVAVLILVISLFSGGGGKGENNYALYLKDNEQQNPLLCQPSSITVIPAPPSCTCSSRYDFTPGTVLRYSRMRCRRMPLPVPCSMRTVFALNCSASSMK